MKPKKTKKPEEKKKRSGPRFRVCILCTTNHPSALEIVAANEKLGLEVHQYLRWYYIILMSPSVWRAPDAQFQEIRSGLFVFREEQIDVFRGGELVEIWKLPVKQRSKDCM